MMLRAALAGAVYFVAVFALGVALGVVRGLWVAPAVGAVWAVAMELPVILLAAWLICARVVRGVRVGPGLSRRCVMGGVSFALLMCAELALSLISGRDLSGHLAHYMHPAAQLGLVGQVVFAVMPVVQGLRRGRA